MIVTCTSCSARFQYGDERFQGARAKRFRCPKCASTFEVLNPALIPVPLPGPSSAPLQGPPAQEAPPKEAVETSRRKSRDLVSLDNLKNEGMPPGLRFSLAFLTGPLGSTVRILDSPITVIGREEGDVVINDPEISRRHARVEIHGDGSAWLTDLDSTNGTFVGTTQITGATRLADRQEFSCGRSTFMLLVRDLNPSGLD